MYHGLRVHEVATTYGAIFYENNFIIVPGLVFVLLVVGFKFYFISKRVLLEFFYCGLESYFVWCKPFDCKFVVLTPVLCLFHIQMNLTFILLTPFCVCVESKNLTVPTT